MIRITNRLRAIRDRGVRWVSDQTMTGEDKVKLGRIVARGPYATWLPRKVTKHV